MGWELANPSPTKLLDLRDVYKRSPAEPLTRHLMSAHTPVHTVGSQALPAYTVTWLDATSLSEFQHNVYSIGKPHASSVSLHFVRLNTVCKRSDASRSSPLTLVQHLEICSAGKRPNTLIFPDETSQVCEQQSDLTFVATYSMLRCAKLLLAQKSYTRGPWERPLCTVQH